MRIPRILACVLVVALQWSGLMGWDAQAQITRPMMPVDMLNIPVNASNVPYPITARSGAGSSCTAATLNTAITAIGTTSRTLLLVPNDGAGAACTWTLEANVTTNANTFLLIEAPVSVNAGMTLTINGPWESKIGPNWYSGSGTVTINHREWSVNGMASYIVSGCAPNVPGASLSLDAFACRGNILRNNQWHHVNQASAGVGPLSSGNGTYWLALHRDTTTAVTGWTRQTGTSYLWQLATSQPADPDGGLVTNRVTVAAGAISAVLDLDVRHATQARGIIYSDDFAHRDSGTDHTQRLQHAMDAAAARSTGSNTGGIVQLSARIYNVGALTWPPGVTIRGAGKDITELRSNAAVDMLTLTIIPGGNPDSVSGGLEGLSLNGNNIGLRGIVLQDANKFSLERIGIYNFTTRGIQNNGSEVLQIKQVEVRNNNVGLEAVASLIAPFTPPNFVVIRDSIFTSNITRGIDWLAGRSLNITDTDFEDNGTTGNAATGSINIAGMASTGAGMGLVMRNSWSERCKGHSCLRISGPSNSRNVNLIDGSFFDAGTTATYGVHIAGADARLVINNSTLVNAISFDLSSNVGTFFHLHNTYAGTVERGGTIHDELPEVVDRTKWRLGVTELYLSNPAAQLGVGDDPAAGVHLHVGDPDGTRTSGTILVDIGTTRSVTVANRGSGFEHHITHGAVGGAVGHTQAWYFRNNAGTGPGASAQVQASKVAGVDTTIFDWYLSSAISTLVNLFRLNPIGAAEDTGMFLYDITAASLKRVSRGAVDSCGVGFRCLRIPN